MCTLTALLGGHWGAEDEVRQRGRQGRGPVPEQLHGLVEVSVDLPVHDGKVEQAHQRAQKLELRRRGFEHLSTCHRPPVGQ